MTSLKLAKISVNEPAMRKSLNWQVVHGRTPQSEPLLPRDFDGLSEVCRTEQQNY